jgi:diguanylate cyclase (GGDEF)-like protein/PAS domain S-box-containing protein
LQKEKLTTLFSVTAIYLLLAVASGYLFEAQFTFFTIRLAPGFGLIAALVYGSPAILGIFFGEFLYFYFQHNTEITVPIALAMAASASLYAYIGVLLLRRYIKPPYKFTNTSDSVKLFMIGGFAANLVPSFLAVFFISLIEPSVQNTYWLMAAHWLFGQSLGVFIIAPIVLCFTGRSIPIWVTRVPLIPIFLTVLLAGVVIFYAYVSVLEKGKLQSMLDQKALSLDSAIKLQISNYEESLYNIKSLFEYTPDISPHEFEVFSNKIKARQPGLHAISYQTLVKAHERQAYEDMMRKIYSDNFSITERDGAGNFVSAGDRNEYTPVTMRSFFDKNARIMGFDTSTSIYSRSARQQVKETNKIAISHAFKLDSSQLDHKSIILYSTVMNDDDFNGFVSLSFYVNTAIQSALQGINLDDDLSLKVWEDHYPGENIIFNTSSGAIKPVLFSTGKITFISHDWNYELISDSSYLAQLITSQLLAIIFCILLCGVVSVRLLEHTGKRYELSRRASESESRFEGAFANSAIGMAITSLDHKILDANPSFNQMLGYKDGKLEGISFTDITFPDDVKASTEYHQKLINKEIEHYTIEKRYVHAEGYVIWVLLNVSLTSDDEGIPLYGVAQIQDITKQKEHTDELNHLASHDLLTGLANRREFERRAERLLATVKLDKNEHALCFMDLDQFKVINDTCGHSAGDEMLRQLGSVLQTVVRHRDTLARLGGDEFGVLMEHCSLDDAHRVAASLQKAIQDYQFLWEGRNFKIGVSLGLVPISANTTDLTQLLKEADVACYMAKDSGRNRIHVYHADDTEIAQRQGEMLWVTRINQAIEEDRFCLYAQPIVPLDGSSENHYELLLRMIDNDGKTIPPGAFLPAAERYNLILKLDYWVVENTFKFLVDNPRFQKHINFCSINLSGQSLADQDFLEFIIKQLITSEIPGEKLCFEITETAAISNLTEAMNFISTLKDMNCRFALDDFGSGLSSFAYLKNLPVDYLKIDGMFVKDIVDDPMDHAMVKSINEIGHVMGMETIAEFVENEVIMGMLKEIGVNYVQGYIIGRPMPFDELLNDINNTTEII